MRATPSDPRKSATVTLIILNAVMFVVQNVLERFGHFPVDYYFALSTAGLRHGFVWQLLSFQFMHGGLVHLLLNCLAIYMFGRDVEEALGRRGFWTLYFSAGVIGGLVQSLAGVFVGGQFAAPVVGASAGAFGLIAAYATLYPEREWTILAFLIIPVHMRAKFLLLFEALIAIYGVVFPSDHIAHAAHLGGMLTGVLFIRYAIHWRLRLPQFNRPRSSPPRKLIKVHAERSFPWSSHKPQSEPDLPTEEFLAREVDPILEKISAHGIHSLTDRERRILEAARNKVK